MLRKVKLENKALQAEICQLKLDNVVLGFIRAKDEEEYTQLKVELEETKTEFVKKKKELETSYQQ